MKKVITVCLCLILALSALSVACAEDYTIHAGTMFGDTMKQVKEKENNTDVVEFPVDGTTIGLYYIGMTIAGYENCDIIYYFDVSKDYLCDVTYSMTGPIKFSEDDILNRFDELETLLTEKYGKPLSNDDEAYYLISGVSRKSKYESDYIGWSVPCGDYNVKVELVKKYKDNKPISIAIDYHQYTDEELEKAKNGIKEDIDDTNTHNTDDL